MKRLFDFEPSGALLQVKLAFSYTPKVLSSYIPHRPYSGLLYVKKGTYEYTYEGGRFIAGAGSVIYLPPQSATYSYKILPEADGSAAQALQIEFDLKDAETKKSLAYAKHPILLFADGAELQAQFTAVITAAMKKDCASALQMQASLYALLAHCALKAGKTDNRTTSRITPAILYLQENYTRGISTEDLAKMCYISPSQLRRLFHKQMGKTPLAYKKELCLQHAKTMLISSELSVGEIADLLGFYDIYAFSHFFADAAGMPPSVYRSRKSE